MNNLLLNRLVLSNVIHKNKLRGVGGYSVPRRVVEHVIPTGQNQQRFAVGTDDGGDGLSRQGLGIIGKSWGQRHERGGGWRGGRDLLAAVGNSLLRAHQRNERAC